MLVDKTIQSKGKKIMQGQVAASLLRSEKDVNPKIFEAEVQCCLSTTQNHETRKSMAR